MKLFSWIANRHRLDAPYDDPCQPPAGLGYDERWMTHPERGATSIEYGLIAALIAVAAITAMTALGNNLQKTFNNVSQNMKSGDYEAPALPAATRDVLVAKATHARAASKDVRAQATEACRKAGVSTGELDDCTDAVVVDTYKAVL